MTIPTAESRRRGCAFKNLSGETVPPYACMMLVSPPERRAVGTGNEAIYKKSTGVRYFGEDVDNEISLYIDKCDLWGQLMQDPNRFVFNGEISVPAGGVGYCSFGEYPVRAWLAGAIAPFRSNLWDGCFYATIRDSWQVYPSSSQGAFKYFATGTKSTRLIYLTPNVRAGLMYAIWGTFSGEGIADCLLVPQGDSWFDGVVAGGAIPDMFEYPSYNVTQITLKLPGVYVVQYRGKANAKDPDPEDTTIAFSYEIESNAPDSKFTQETGAGLLKKVSDGYSGYWPPVQFDGHYVVAVTDTPVTVKITQTLTEKVEATGYWRIVWDRERTAASSGWYDHPNLEWADGMPWWIWGSYPGV